MKPFPALCVNCRFSKPKPQLEWNNQCFNPKVVAKDTWALANNDEGNPTGASCYDERRKTSWLAPCVAKGKLWEPK